MSSVDYTLDLQVNKIQRRVAAILWEEYNDELDAIDLVEQANDAAFYQDLDMDPLVISSEHVPIERIYSGHRPSLIEAPISYYPNVSVMTYTATPRTSADDEATWYDELLAVEVMAKCEGDESDINQPLNMQAQDIVNTRVNRMLQAVVNIVQRHDTLDGMVQRIVPAPTINIGVLFVRREEKGRGPRWFWQGARLVYTIEKFATFQEV